MIGIISAFLMSNVELLNSLVTLVIPERTTPPPPAVVTTLDPTAALATNEDDNDSSSDEMDSSSDEMNSSPGDTRVHTLICEGATVVGGCRATQAELTTAQTADLLPVWPSTLQAASLTRA